MPERSSSGRRWHGPAGLLASGLLIAAYAAFDAAWPLGFVALVPWLLTLQGAPTWRTLVLNGLAMSALYTLAALWWFGLAIGAYTGAHPALAMAALVLASPLLQPQLLAFAVAHHAVRRRFGTGWALAAGAAAWLATEGLWPKLLGDTLGHGLHAIDALRASAALWGAAGLTLLLLLVNAAIAHAAATLTLPASATPTSAAPVRRPRGSRRRARWVLTGAAALVAAASLAGALRLQSLEAAEAADLAADAQHGPPLRVAMVQTGFVDYERRRRERGSYAVVREVLDAHFELSYAAARDHGAGALVWSETVYPTTFGTPQSADGAAFDAEIQQFIEATGTPLLFGTYERDALGEYNAAVLLEPGSGRLASYRKTHPFPFTERVPPWLDGPALRRTLPWTGAWKAGDGARVLPLRGRDGREVQVLPLICLDDVRPQLAIDGARLGAQAIVGLSNDAWFTAWPRGARLHLAVAAFRSAETGLPQLRATTNGMSAIVDESGKVLVHTQMGQQATLTGELRARDPRPTLMVRWGDWVGRAGLAFLAGLGFWSFLAWRRERLSRPESHARAGDLRSVPLAASLLPPPLRALVGLLRCGAGLGLAWLAFDMATRGGWQIASLSQLQGFGLLVLLPLGAAWALRRVRGARLRIDGGRLVIERTRERVEIPLPAIADAQAWRVPLPGPGIDLVLGSGRRWSLALDATGPALVALASAGVAGKATLPDRRAGGLASMADQRALARHRWLDHPLLKFGLFPLLPALVAFRLHQMIAFGGTFGEWQTFGAGAWFAGLAIWWGAWSLGMMLLAAALRVLAEIACTAAYWAFRSGALAIRHANESFIRGVHYVITPIALLVRLLA